MEIFCLLVDLRWLHRYTTSENSRHAYDRRETYQTFMLSHKCAIPTKTRENPQFSFGAISQLAQFRNWRNVGNIVHRGGIRKTGYVIKATHMISSN